MPDKKYDAFVSYRRQYDPQTARLLLEALDDEGFNIFLDVDGLVEGHFAEALLGQIASAPNFIVILSEHSLDRRDGDGDWFCREIEQAIESGKNVIPVMMPAFMFPPKSELPEGIRALPDYNGVNYSHELFKATVEKIILYMKGGGFWRWFFRRPVHRFDSWLRGFGRVARAVVLALLVLTPLAAGAGGYILLRPRYVRLKGSARDLTGLRGQELAPSFAPGGDEVVFVSDDGTGKFDLYVKLPSDDGAVATQLTYTDAVEHSPAWSPAGDYIAYLRDPRDPREKWYFCKIMKTGGAEVRIAEAFPNRNYGGRIETRSLSWAGDGEHLAVMDRNSASDPFSIYLIPARPGGGRVQLTHPKLPPGDSNPAFSPDGQTLAFTRAASTGSSNIYLQHIRDGQPDGDPMPVTSDNTWVADLAWTPDGKYLIYSMAKGGPFTLWMLPAAKFSPGVNPRMIAGLSQNLFSPAVSIEAADSSKWELAYASFGVWDIDIMQYRLGQPKAQAAGTPLPFQPSARWEISPHFSSNGGKLCFASDISGRRQIYIYELKADELKAGELKTGEFINMTRFRGGADTGSPHMSPDGSRVAFDTEENGNRDIYVMNADRQAAETALVTDPSLDVRPSWSADGQWVYFGSDRTGKWQVWKVAAGGGNPVPVTKGGGREALASPDGTFIYYAKDTGDHWELWRVPTEGGDETPVLDHVRQGFWAVTAKGIYHLEPEGTVPLTINLYRFDTGKDEPTGVKLSRDPGTNAPGLAVSPDDNVLLIQQEVSRQSNIQVVELTH